MASAGHGLSTEMPPPSARLAYENQTETGGAATAEIALDECFRLAMHVPYFQLNDPIMLSVHAGCLHHLIELLLPPILELTAMCHLYTRHLPNLCLTDSKNTSDMNDLSHS